MGPINISLTIKWNLARVCQQLVQALLKFSGFGPLSLVDYGPGVLLVRLEVLGSGGGAWGELPPEGLGDSYSPLFPDSKRTVYIKLKSNNNLIGSCSLTWNIAFCAILGLLLHWEKSCDRLEVFRGWGLLPGGLWCRSDLISRMNNRKRVE